MPIGGATRGSGLPLCPHCSKEVNVAQIEGLIERIRMLVCPTCRKVFYISSKSK